MMMIEALMAILIFSLGILGMVGVNALAVSSQSDARYRTDANEYATQIINQMWLSVDRTSGAATPASLAVFNHQTTGTNCPFSGSASGSSLVADWAVAAAAGLPGATAAMQQVVVGSAAEPNEVTVTLCWKAPGDVVARKHVMYKETKLK